MITPLSDHLNSPDRQTSFTRSDTGRKRLRQFSKISWPNVTQRVQRLGLIDVEERVVAARQNRRHVIAESLELRSIDDTDRPMPARLEDFRRMINRFEDQ